MVLACQPFLSFLIWLNVLNVNVNVIASEYEYRCVDDQPCIIDCMNSNKCAGKAIYCPSNNHCVIHCGSVAACKHSIVYAQHSSFLSISVTASVSNAQYLVIYTPFPWNENYVKSKLVCATATEPSPTQTQQTLHHCEDLQIFASRGFNDIDLTCDDDSALCNISGSMQCGYDEQYSYDRCVEFTPSTGTSSVYECLTPVEFCAFPHLTTTATVLPTNDSSAAAAATVSAPSDVDDGDENADEERSFAFHKEEEYDSLLLVIVGTLVISCTILLMMGVCGFLYVRLNHKQGKASQIIQRYMMHSHSHHSHHGGNCKYMNSCTNTSLNLQRNDRNNTITSSPKHTDTEVDITAILDDVHVHEQHIEQIIIGGSGSGSGGGGVSPMPADHAYHETETESEDEEHDDDERQHLKANQKHVENQPLYANVNHLLSVNDVACDSTPVTDTQTIESCKSETDEKCSLSKHVLMLHEPIAVVPPPPPSLAEQDHDDDDDDDLDCYHTQIHPRSIEEMEAEAQKQKQKNIVQHPQLPQPPHVATPASAMSQSPVKKTKRKYKYRPKKDQSQKSDNRKKKKKKRSRHNNEMDSAAIIVSSAQRTKLSEHQKEILLQNLRNRAKCFGYQQPDVLYEEDEDYTSDSEDSDDTSDDDDDDVTKRRKKIFIIEQVDENEETGTDDMDQQHDTMLRVFQHSRTGTMHSVHPNGNDNDNAYDNDNDNRKHSNATTITLTDDEYGKLTQILEAPMTINIDKNHSINIIKMTGIDSRNASNRTTLASLDMTDSHMLANHDRKVVL